MSFTPEGRQKNRRSSSDLIKEGEMHNPTVNLQPKWSVKQMKYVMPPSTYE
jgi:hypothetical protein